MGVFKNIIEPGVIVLAFTAGTLINRRSKQLQRARKNSENRAGPPRPTCSDTKSLPEESQFRNNVTSRFMAYFPFLLEIWYWNLTYWVYQLSRALSSYYVRGNQAVLDRARQHALSILFLEKHLGVDIELQLQKYILRNIPGLMPILTKVYHAHIIVGVIFIVYTYTYLPRALFQRIRRTIAVDNVLAFIILTTWRCMPPRLLPKEYGFLDILHGTQQSAWTNNRFQLTIAAMPSLHFGTSAFIGFCLWRFAPHRPLKYLAPLWPSLMLLTILATANHFVIDAVVGAMIPAMAWRMNELVLSLGPLEEYVFRLLRTEKPSVLEGEILEGAVP